MPRFFVETFLKESPALTGENARHAVKSLRLRPGESLTVCDKDGFDHLCEVEAVTQQGEVRLIERACAKNQSEPSVFVTLYQGLPKGDKMELIVQKAVELGVCAIVPVHMERCVSRPDEKALSKKGERWQKIAEEAAKQSGRGVIPRVCPALTLKAAAQRAAGDDLTLTCFEGGGERLQSIGYENVKSISVFIGPEGGLEETEVSLLKENGAVTVTLGPRILRTETAPLMLLSVLMYQTGNI